MSANVDAIAFHCVIMRTVFMLCTWTDQTRIIRHFEIPSLHLAQPRSYFSLKLGSMPLPPLLLTYVHGTYLVYPIDICIVSAVSMPISTTVLLQPRDQWLLRRDLLTYMVSTSQHFFLSEHQQHTLQWCPTMVGHWLTLISCHDQ